jgi:hypothetical protein
MGEIRNERRILFGNPEGKKLLGGSGCSEGVIRNYMLHNYRMSEKSGTNGIFIYYLHYMLYIFTPTLYAFSQPRYHVCADFAQHIGVEVNT